MPSDTPTLPAQGASSSYEEGQVLGGKYRLERMLAQGGMGSVWRARNISLDVPVAVKVVATAVDREWLRPRFMREANAAARLRHPAIVRVFDVDQTAQGDPYIVMELLEGETLTKRLTPRLDPIEAVRLLLPIVDALRVAHQGGVVHRDVKPENVFLALDGGHLQPKLLDFGIVKVDRTDGNRLTERGEFVGTPEYMSPEQARGRDDLDATTDIWSLCVVLYEAVTGRLPFQNGENYRALLRAIVEDAPTPISELGPEDAELVHIIERGLAKDPRERWLTMHELGTALALYLIARNVRDDATGSSIEVRWLDRRPSLPTPQPSVVEATSAASVVGVEAKLRSTQRRNRLMAGGIAAGVALTALLLWVLARPGASAEPASAASAPPARPPEEVETVAPAPSVTALVETVSSMAPDASATAPEAPPAAAPKAPEPRTKPAKDVKPSPRASDKVDAPLDLLDPY